MVGGAKGDFKCAGLVSGIENVCAACDDGIMWKVVLRPPLCGRAPGRVTSAMLNTHVLCLSGLMMV